MTAAGRLGTVAVLVKHVPVGGELLALTGGVADRGGVPHGLDPVNEPALEWALRQREGGAADRVVAVSMGPPDAVETLRRALAFGADEALLLSDPGLAGADVRRTAHVLAAAAARLGAGLVACGYESLDGSSGVVPAAVAAELGWPLVSRVSTAACEEGGRLVAERDLGAGPETVRAPAPAVLTFVVGGLEVRYPKLRDSLASRKKPVETLSLADLGSDLPTRGQRVLAVEDVPTPPKERRRLSADDGPAALLALLEGAGVDRD